MGEDEEEEEGEEEEQEIQRRVRYCFPITPPPCSRVS